MTDYSDLVIQPLDSRHNRREFHCGVDSLDNYIHKQARQDVKRRISRVFIATAVEQANSIVGYYTLSTLSVEFAHLPQTFARKLPRYPVPAALIGRLAVNQVAQTHGVGKMLLVDAIKRTLAISNEIAIYAMVVDAIDERAQLFYEQFGFLPLSLKNQRLFLPLKSI